MNSARAWSFGLAKGCAMGGSAKCGATVWVVMAAVGLLAGCASAPLQTYDLSSASAPATQTRPHGLVLVAYPNAAAPFDGDRIIVRTSATSLATVQGAQWSQTLPRLLQAKLVESFDNAHLMRYVARPSDAVTADSKLLLDIRRFEIDVTTGEAVVEISAKLVAERSGRILAGDVFAARVPGSASDGTSAALALDSALSPVLSQIVGWASARG